jgi:CBS-domain-containing membrane protein
LLFWGSLHCRIRRSSERRTGLGITIVGAAGGAVAIALMEFLSERAAQPLMVVPFATSIVLVMGDPLAALAFAWHGLFRRGTWPARWW